MGDETTITLKLEDIADESSQTEVFQECPVPYDRKKYPISEEREKKCRLCNQHGMYFVPNKGVYSCGLYKKLMRLEQEV